MKQLFIRDLMILKKSWKTLILYILIFGITFGLKSPIGTYSFLGIMLPYLFILLILGYNDKYNINKFICSLPVKRKDILKSQFISLYVYYIFSILVSTGIVYIASSLNIFNEFIFPNLTIILLQILVLTILMSIYIPLYYKFGMNKMRIVQFFIVFFTIFAGQFIFSIISYINDNTKSATLDPFLRNIYNIIQYINNSPSYILYILLILLNILIIYIGYTFSKLCFNNKDL